MSSIPAAATHGWCQGREAIARAYPLWQQAQARIVQGSGADRWQAVAGGLEEVAALALRS